MLINSVKNTVKNKAVLICKRYDQRHYLALFPLLATLTSSNKGNSKRAGFVPPALPFSVLLTATTRLFLLLSLFFFSSAPFAQESNCSYHSFDKRERVTRVYDGDTVKLANGEKIRLIGINTPEINYKTGNPEPYAKKAKRFLEKRVLNKRVGIKYGKEKKDRYKRKLGHLFLLNGDNIQYQMLAAGLAFNITIPPNLWQHNCYQKAAKTAQQKRLNIWKSPYYKPIAATKINKHKLGFRRINGKVENVLRTKKTIWIKFSDKMALRISKKDLHYFTGLRPKTLIGKQVSASGWISLYKNRFSMRIKHPNALIIH